MTQIAEPTDLVDAQDPAADSVPPIDPDDYGRTGEPGDRAEIGRPFVRPARLAFLVAFFGGLTLWRGLPVLVIVLCVIMMVFFHELGHYVMARRAGMKVTEFMIGFGPRIFSFRRGDVEYGLKSIPAGAYVKIIGMANVEEVPEVDEPQTYRQKGYWARMGVAFAGPAANFVQAIALMTIAFAVLGRTDVANWEVATVAPESAAAEAGIRLGDRVVEIAGTPVETWQAMADEAQANPGETVPITVIRDGEKVALTASISPRFSAFGTIGEDLTFYGNADGGVSLSLFRESKLETQGLKDGDVVTGVNGVPVETVEQLHAALSDSPSKATGQLTLDVERGQNAVASTAEVSLGSALDVGKVKGFLGVGQDLVPLDVSPIAAVPEAFSWFGNTVVQSVQGIGSFFNPSNLVSFVERTFSTAPGETHATNVPQEARATATAREERDGNRISSIVGIIGVGESITEDGWSNMLGFLAAVNLALGVLNLLPLPPFDGGHMMIATYERIRELTRRDGRRYLADFNKIMPVAAGVIIVMLVISMMAIYLDIADPIRV